MRVQQVVSNNLHFILPVAVIAGFGLVFNILGGAAGLLYVAGVVAAVYYYSQPGTTAKQAVVSQVKAQSFAEELIAEEKAEMEAAKQRSSKSKSKSKSKGSATTVSKKVLEREAALNASSALDDDSDDDLLYLAAANPQTRKIAQEKLQAKRELAADQKRETSKAKKGAGKGKGKKGGRR